MKKLILLFLPIWLLASTETPKIGIFEQLGKTIPLDIPFTDSTGKTVTFQKISNNKPIILTINYYTCPTLCSPLLHGVSDVLSKLDMKPGESYQAITVSIDPDDTPKQAKEKKEEMLASIKKPFPTENWSFLTGTQESIDTLVKAVGFYYEERYKDGVKDYLHPGAIIVLSPSGKVARYLNGTLFLHTDLKMAIYEASEERFGPTIAKTLLYCFAYDPESKSYVFQFEKIFGILMTLSVGGFGAYLFSTRRKEEPHERG